MSMHMLYMDMLCDMCMYVLCMCAWEEGMGSRVSLCPPTVRSGSTAMSMHMHMHTQHVHVCMCMPSHRALRLDCQKRPNRLVEVVIHALAVAAHAHRPPLSTSEPNDALHEAWQRIDREALVGEGPHVRPRAQRVFGLGRMRQVRILTHGVARRYPSKKLREGVPCVGAVDDAVEERAPSRRAELRHGFVKLRGIQRLQAHPDLQPRVVGTCRRIRQCHERVVE